MSEDWMKRAAEEIENYGEDSGFCGRSTALEIIARHAPAHKDESGLREATIEECAKVADEFATVMPVTGDGQVDSALSQFAGAVRAAIRALSAQPSTSDLAGEEGAKRWPFLETPGQFADRLADALDQFGKLLPAIRYVLIENPPTLATPPAPSVPLEIRKDDWQPIETAPKDGTEILGFDPEGIHGPVIAVVHWYEHMGEHFEPAENDLYRKVETAHSWWDGANYTPFRATHWRPLSEPPALQAPAGEKEG